MFSVELWLRNLFVLFFGNLSPAVKVYSGMRPEALLLLLTGFVLPLLAQAPRTPDVAAQRAAMKKLSFLVGNWSGEGWMLRSPTEKVEFRQTERAAYQLDGLLLTVEGVGHNKTDGKPVLQALGIMSYDDASGTYHFRAFNDGRWLETDVQLLTDGQGMSWGFTVGQYQTRNLLRMNDKGEWTEEHEISVGGQPARKFMEITVHREK